MNTATAIKKEPVSVFDEEFEEILQLASPFMSEFLHTMVSKLRSGAKGASIQLQQHARDECLEYMAKGLEFAIAERSRKKGPTNEAHVRRLRNFVDQLE